MRCFFGSKPSLPETAANGSHPASPAPRAPTSPQLSSNDLADGSKQDIVGDLLQPGRKAVGELKKLFQSAGMAPVPVARDSMLVNLSMVQLMGEDHDPDKLWASPSGRLQASVMADAAGTSTSTGVPAAQGAPSRLSMRAASSGVPQRGFVRLSSMAHGNNRGAMMLDGLTPTVTTSGTTGPASSEVLPGSTDPSAVQQQAAGHNALSQQSIMEEESESPSQNRALNWTASRRALAVLVVREEHLSRNDKKVANMSHERRLAERLERLNLETIYIEGDGNCQFRTLAHELLGNQQFHQDVRDKVIAHIKRNKQEYECFLGEDFQAYVDSMAKSRTWGDELTLRAACDALKVTVNVLTSDATNWYILYEPSVPIPGEPREIFLAYTAPVHYFAIKRRSSLRKLSKSLSSSFKRLANSGQLKGANSGNLKSPTM